MNTESVEVTLSFVLAGSTLIYTIINIFMLRESRATRKQKISPFIVAYLQSTDSHTVEVLHIKNIGEGYAKDVQFKVIKDYNRLEKEHLPLSKCEAIKRGISSFPPQYEITYYIETWLNIANKNIKDYIELEISYKRIDDKILCHTYKLPLNELEGQNYSNPPDTYIGQIAHNLNEINKTLKQNQK